MNNAKRFKEKEELEKCRESFRRWLVKWTGCQIQSGLVKGKMKKFNAWPCGTCTIDLLVRLGVKENKQHNNPLDRCNEVWRGILQIRGE